MHIKLLKTAVFLADLFEHGKLLPFNSDHMDFGEDFIEGFTMNTKRGLVVIGTDGSDDSTNVMVIHLGTRDKLVWNDFDDVYMGDEIMEWLIAKDKSMKRKDSSHVYTHGNVGESMDGKEAVAQLTREIADMFYPRSELTAREVFNSLVKSAKRNYKWPNGSMGYSVHTETVEVEGQEYEVELHYVGHNASHQFSVGLLPDGRLIVQSCGEGDEWSEELGYYLSETKVHVIGTAEKCRWPYVGHY